MLLGKFLDARSKHESTEAGKMMSYIGYAEEYMSKKRNSLYPSITRLMTVSFCSSISCIDCIIMFGGPVQEVKIPRFCGCIMKHLK